jgi:Flp pilus assembly protein TadD
MVTPAGRGDLAAQTLRGAEDRLGKGSIGEACALGQVAAGQAPRLPAVWEFLGRCYMRLPDPERARSAYRKYLELAPDAPRASLIRVMVERDLQ